MKIAVLLEAIPDAKAKLRIREDKLGIEEKGLEFMADPFGGEIAVELAIRLRENHGGTIIFITIGQERAKTILENVLAMGLTEDPDGSGVFDESKIDDRAILASVNDGSLVQNPLIRAKILSKVIADDIGGCDIILCGKKSAGDGFGQVGAAIAEFLDIPLHSAVTELELIQKDEIKTHLRTEGGERVFKSSLPAVLTCEKGLKYKGKPINEGRIASGLGIMAVDEQKIKPIYPSFFTKELEELGAVAKEIRYLGLSYPSERIPGVMLKGEPGGTPKEKVEELLKVLKEKVKIL